MTTYEFLLFAHVLLAVIWVGGGFALTVMGIRAQRSRDPVRVAGIVKDAEWMGKRVLSPASILLLFAGIGLVLEGDWGFSTDWVLFGIVIYALSAVTGMAFFGPETARIDKLIEAQGVEDAQVQSRINRLLNVARIDTVLLVLVVFMMTTKPGG